MSSEQSVSSMLRQAEKDIARMREIEKEALRLLAVIKAKNA